MNGSRKHLNDNKKLHFKEIQINRLVLRLMIKRKMWKNRFDDKVHSTFGVFSHTDLVNLLTIVCSQSI